LIIIVLVLAGCLPTRNRFEFESETGDAPDAEAISDSGGDSGNNDAGETGDGGTNPDGETPDATVDTGGTTDTGSMADTGSMTDAGSVTDTGSMDACTPETDETFCMRLAVECGVYEDTDNCGEPRTANCGGCPADGVGCSTDNVCIETDCRDDQDNDGAGGADCDDPNCLGERCHPNPNLACQADGSCQ
jgi:hypothetical protein